MALKVKAVERLLKFDKEKAGKYRYVMKAEMYYYKQAAHYQQHATH